jgi:hypothetical protein
MNPIDAFVLDRLDREGLVPAQSAGRATLIRRVTFDLVGLPPTPEEIRAFLDDSRPDAYDRLLDRLLQSPHFGERWGRHWLDVVRYADSSGFETDLMYPNAWRFRDFIIRSFNNDKPIDRLIQEQVAADELWPDDREATLGTMLYCVGPVQPESAFIDGLVEQEWLTDSADTTGAAFLGLTVGCARCHNHKYDPISQHDYYALQAFFAASDRPYPEKVRVDRIKALNGLLSDAPVPKTLLNDPRCALQLESKAGYRLFRREQPLEVHRLKRGEVSQPAEVVEPGFPAALSEESEELGRARAAGVRRRADLAHWLTSPRNPLTARVFVNRVWGWHFGRGLVATPSDFGSQGEPPSHPELLDWLAADLVAHGWSLKRLNRLILSSHTYQMSSVASGGGLTADPDDILLWHFPRQRLEGEAIRDAMLAVAGNLNETMEGPPVVPPLGTSELTGLFDANEKWQVPKDASEHTRRSIYLITRRTFVYPMFAAFDSPELMTSCAGRMHTIVPSQALVLLNSPFARSQAERLARQLIDRCGGETDEALELAWNLAFGRGITEAETAKARDFLSRQRGRSASPDRTSPLGALCLALYNANEFLYID